MDQILEFLLRFSPPPARSSVAAAFKNDYPGVLPRPLGVPAKV